MVLAKNALQLTSTKQVFSEAVTCAKFGSTQSVGEKLKTNMIDGYWLHRQEVWFPSIRIATMQECPYIGFVPHAGARQDICVWTDVPEKVGVCEEICTWSTLGETEDHDDDKRSG